jgi:hypothetical protein
MADHLPPWHEAVSQDPPGNAARNGLQYGSVAETRNSIGGYLTFYNRKWPRLSPDGQTPDNVYLGDLATAEVA